MSKYEPLWKYIKDNKKEGFIYKIFLILTLQNCKVIFIRSVI